MRIVLKRKKKEEKSEWVIYNVTVWAAEREVLYAYIHRWDATIKEQMSIQVCRVRLYIVAVEEYYTPMYECSNIPYTPSRRDIFLPARRVHLSAARDRIFRHHDKCGDHVHNEFYCAVYIFCRYIVYQSFMPYYRHLIRDSSTCYLCLLFSLLNHDLRDVYLNVNAHFSAICSHKWRFTPRAFQGKSFFSAFEINIIQKRFQLDAAFFVPCSSRSSSRPSVLLYVQCITNARKFGHVFATLSTVTSDGEIRETLQPSNGKACVRHEACFLT